MTVSGRVLTFVAALLQAEGGRRGAAAVGGRQSWAVPGYAPRGAGVALCISEPPPLDRPNVWVRPRT